MRPAERVPPLVSQPAALHLARRSQPAACWPFPASPLPAPADDVLYLGYQDLSALPARSGRASVLRYLCGWNVVNGDGLGLSRGKAYYVGMATGPLNQPMVAFMDGSAGFHGTVMAG